LDRFWLTHSVVALASADQVEVAAARGDVASVIADKRYFATTLNISRPLIKADQVANTLHFKGPGITVAIIDTGIDVTHPALSSVPIATRQDFTGEGTGDGFGHGTHCAGIVASQDATFTGIAPGATLAEFKILDNTGSGTSSNAVAGIQAAVTAQVHVASNSWGFSHGGGWVDPNGHCVLCNAADAASAAGVVFVAAAGNEGGSSGGCSTPDTLIRCPGNARTAITVGASDDSDKMASFSSPGPTPDGRTKPDVTGPGVQIASCRATGTQLAASVGPPLDPTSIFIRLDGTSMATPHVAGVAALMLSKPATPTHPPADIKAILMRTAVNIGATANEMGSGRIDALAAVNAS
jgi:serine protease AprX